MKRIWLEKWGEGTAAISPQSPGLPASGYLCQELPQHLPLKPPRACGPLSLGGERDVVRKAGHASEAQAPCWG